MSDMPMATAMKALRKQYELGQAPFAALVQAEGGELRAGTLSSVETGRRNMSESAIDDLANALALTDQQRADLQAARRLQAAIDGEAATATRLKAVEDRLKDLEQWRKRVERQLANRNFTLAADDEEGGYDDRTESPPGQDE